jgi:hypothetical protein
MRSEKSLLFYKRELDVRRRDFFPLYMLDDTIISNGMKSRRHFEIMIVNKCVWDYSVYMFVI